MTLKIANCRYSKKTWGNRKTGYAQNFGGIKSSMGAGDRITGKWEIEIDPKRDWLSKYWRKLFDADQYKTGFKSPQASSRVPRDID